MSWFSRNILGVPEPGAASLAPEIPVQDTEILQNSNQTIAGLLTDQPARKEMGSTLLFDDFAVSNGFMGGGFVTYFNGEKNLGNLGTPVNMLPDFQAIRMRAHKANLDSDLVKIITGKFFKWVIGAGLKLQAEPAEGVLKREGIVLNDDEFRSNVEDYWNVWVESPASDYSGMRSLNDLAEDSFNHAFIGGDMLNILRLDNNYNVTVQVIDGQHVKSPMPNSPFHVAAKKAGNTIMHGVEQDATGKDIAYYVYKFSPDKILPDVERVLAWDIVSGCRVSWLTIVSKHRIDHRRGISNLAHILEKIAKTDRYTEASVSRAEEIAKVVYALEHGRTSTGESAFLNNLKRDGSGDIGNWEKGEAVSRRIQATEEKNAYNLPIDSKLVTLNSTGEINFPAFFDAIFSQLCASQDIPPEVAVQKYSSNYSASRAAINGWQYIINYYRKKFSRQFYQYVYNYWLYVHILKSKVPAPGYLNARATGNMYVVEAYQGAKFSGPNMPHLDPLKEANAMRTILGDDVTPLGSFEQIAEMLNLGDWYENYKKYLHEYELIDQSKQPKKAGTVVAGDKTDPEEEDDATDSQTEE